MKWLLKKDIQAKKFFLAIGNKYLPSKIIEDQEDPQAYREQGYNIIQVPIEHKNGFELDMSTALTNVAGIALSSGRKYFHWSNLKKVIKDHLRNPMRSEIISLGFNDESQLVDFFLPELVSMEDRYKPCFIHLDLSKSGDCTGFGMSNIQGGKDVRRYEKSGDMKDIRDLCFRVLMGFAIKAVPGQQIPFHKIREFIYALRRDYEFNIQGVSADSYQSVDMIQQLSINGFNTSTLSLDRTPDGYLTLRFSITEERLEMPMIGIAKDELLDLEEDTQTGIVDHPQDGSKDVSDGISGSILGATRWKFASQYVNNSVDMEITTEVLVEDDPVTELIAGLVNNALPNGKHVVTDYDDLMDDILDINSDEFF